MKLLQAENAEALIAGADLALAQGRSWFLFRGNRVKYKRVDALPLPEPFNIMSVYNFTTKYGESLDAAWSINPNGFGRDKIIVRT